jgi:hypothetical protein
MIFSNNINRTNKPLKLRTEHQELTPNLFSQLVWEEIDKHFNIRYLTDLRIHNIFYERNEEYSSFHENTPSVIELKQEMYEVFFKSFDSICTDIGNTKQSNGEYVNNNLRQEKKLYIWWFDANHEIESYIIVHNGDNKYAVKAYTQIVGKQQIKRKNIFRQDKSFNGKIVDVFKPLTFKNRHMHVYFNEFVFLENEGKDYDIARYTQLRFIEMHIKYLHSLILNFLA